MKKILFLLALLISGVGSFAESFVVDGLTYTINDSRHGEVSLTDGHGTTGSLAIPANVVYNGVKYRTTSIGKSAFAGCIGLTSLTIPNSITSIDDSAFNKCDRLKILVSEADTPPAYRGLDISGAVLYVPSGKKAIYSRAEGWKKKFISIFDGIPDKAYKTFITEDGILYAPYSETEAFASASDGTIKDATIKPEVSVNGKRYKVNIIPDKSFTDCKQLKSLTIPNSITSIGRRAFNGCSVLPSLTLPNSVTNIGWGAFYRCDRLKVIVCEADIPPTYTRSTFGRTSLDVIEAILYVPSGRKDIYTQADGWKDDFLCIFDGIPDEKFVVENNILYAPNSETQACACSADGSITDAVIKPEVIINGKGYEVNLLPHSSFRNCTELKSVSIPNSVTSIGDIAFAGCSALTSLTIPDSVTSIGKNTFSGCSALTSLIIGNGVIEIKSEAFFGCSALTSLIIPDNVTSIGNSAFCNCYSLTSLSISNNVTYIGLRAFNGCSSLISLTIPDSVTEIKFETFSGCSALTSLTISNSVTSIDRDAFNGCSALTSLTIPNSVTSIGYSAFSGCSAITSLTIPNSVTSIDNEAFKGCSAITSLTLPNSITSIGLSVFSGCSALTSLTIPRSVTVIGEKAFSDCSSLSSLSIPNSVTTIGKNAFSGCSALTSITIPNSVTVIGPGAFYGCSALTSIKLSKSLVTINAYAFKNCSSIAEIVSLNPTPPSCYVLIRGAFDNETLKNATLKVPKKGLKKYLAHSTWKCFNRIEGKRFLR